MKNKIFLLLLLTFPFFLPGCIPTKSSSNPLLAPTTRPTTQNSQLTPTSSASVPLLTGEDIVRVFFELINEKRIPEAVGMLSSTAAPDESTKQTWGVNFNSLESISIKSITEWQKGEWTAEKMTYKVIVVAKVKPESSFYAWDDGENTKWINLVKENNLWKISEIATGP